ncbi:MAG TPA: PhnD/SsuA/transferrin family substrate-binding protein, partial [Anaeromyxobacteraceae bacterium]|nr:PhnD/SsuA/transferrin family substrate-binding protein [Anaeromyxobacteraceae bacterium]
IGAVYLRDEQEGLARLAADDAAVALVPLAFFLAHAERLHLAARLQVATQGAGPTERWTLVARKGRASAPGGLAGLSVSSIAGYAPAFVRGAAGGEGARLPDSTRVVESGQVISALRKAAAGADVAVLLDGEQAAALPSLPFAGDLEVVARSPPVPTALVATVGARLAPARWAELERAFLKLAADPAGAAALEGIRMTGFVAADPRLLAAARALAAGPAR